MKQERPRRHTGERIVKHSSKLDNDASFLLQNANAL